ncbi:MAG: thymidylate synthase [Clostridiales bacterium]
MKHFFVEGNSLPEAYHNALVKLNDEGQIVPCPAYNTETKECGMTFYVENALAEPRLSRCFIGGHHELQQYVMEVCDGILDFMIGKGENVWEYTYHDRIKDQIDFVVKELHNNPNSRRAIIDVRDNSVDMFNDHPACLQNIMVMIRDNKLDMKVLMRSNDATEATFMNAFAFIALQEKIAKELGVGVGSYTHTANSFHSYKKDWGLLANFVARIQENTESTYEYKGFYDELMAGEIPEVMAMVADQKRKYGVK